MVKIRGYISAENMHFGKFKSGSKKIANEILSMQDQNADIVYGWGTNNPWILTDVKNRNDTPRKTGIYGFDAINTLNRILIDNNAGYLDFVYVDDDDVITVKWVQ